MSNISENAYSYDEKVLKENHQERREAIKYWSTLLRNGEITQEEYRVQLEKVDKSDRKDLRSIVDQEGKIITGYKIEKPVDTYDGYDIKEDNTVEYSSSVYAKRNSKRQAERKLLEQLELVMLIYSETRSEEILENYSEDIIDAIKELVDIVGDPSELEDYLAEKRIDLKDEVIRLARK